MSQLLDIDNSTLEQLEAEHEECSKVWGKYSCDCFGYYIKALQDKITSLKHRNHE